MAGFAFDQNSEEVVYGTNVDFSGQFPPAATMLLDGDLLIGTTAVNAGGTHINVGNITTSTLTVGYSSPDITINTVSGGFPIESVDVDVASGTGVDPVVADGTGMIQLTGGQMGPGTIANIIQSHSYAPNSITMEIQQTSTAAAKDVTLNGVSHFDSAQFSNDEGFITIIASPPPPGVVLTLSDTANTTVSPDGGGNIQLEGTMGQIDIVSDALNNKIVFSLPGGATTTTLTPDDFTAPGTSPVVQDGGGTIIVTGDQVAAGDIGANVIRTNSLAANTMTIEIQRTAAVAATDSANNGVAHFDSDAFDVDANGFVQLNGGGIAATSFNVQQATGPGVDPVLPSATGEVTINGAAVANHSVPLETHSRALNTYNVEVQYAAAAAATDATKSGIAHFDSADFSVDASGFVTLSASVPTVDLHVARFIVHPSGNSVGANFTTIAAAIAAAAAGDTIHIQSKATAYNEDITLPTGVNLVGYVADAYTPNVVIKGKITATSAGSRSISGIQLETDGDNILEITGSNAVEVNLISCYLDMADATGIDINNANATVNCFHCKGNLQTTGISIFNIAACTMMNFEYCYFDNTGDSTTANAIASGNLRQWWTRFANPVSLTGDAEITQRWARIECSSLDRTCLTLNTSNDGSNSFHSVYSSGDADGIVLTNGELRLSFADISTDSAFDAISGGGALEYGVLAFRESSEVTVSTQTPYSTGPRIQLAGTGNAQVMCGSGSPNGSVTAPKGSLYLRVDGSSSSTRAYSNTNGGTSWTAFTTAS